MAFTHKFTGMDDHKHNTVFEARQCEDEYYHVPYDEDGEQAMMRVLETNEVQRWETDREEQMVAALGIEEPRDVYWDGFYITKTQEREFRLADARAASTHNGAITAMFRSHCD
jgi:hypothetical protein